MLRLTIRYEDKIQSFPLPRDEARLGSASGNDLVAPFPGISRQHALVRRRPEGVILTDLGSTNGLVRDGQRIDEILLIPGQAVRLGHALLSLEDLSSSDAETALRLRSSHDASSLGASETASAAPSSPAAALRFVRELEAFGPEALSELWRRARTSLGAESLLTFDGLAVTACDGPLPSEEDQTLVAGLPDGPRLAARFAADPEPWQRDFFAYLAEKLLSVSVSFPERPKVSEEGLRFPPGMVMGSSAPIQSLLAQLRATVRGDLNVLLTGETGTGKELFARLIHNSGPHASGPFLAVNCAAIPADLLESELFGIAGRVATGVDARPGLFVQANGGTLFLDEIGDMPERLQAKILRVLQEREVLPLGAPAARRIDVRVIAASNRDLGRLVQEGTFRADLFYRLRGLHFEIPPLRDRREDLPALILSFASRAAAKYGKRIHGVSRRALGLLLEHDWPGNVRELESEIERAVLLCPDGGTLQREHFRDLKRSGEPVAVVVPVESRSLQEKVDSLERESILEALARAKGNKTRAAEILGITRNGLGLKMRRLKIE